MRTTELCALVHPNLPRTRSGLRALAIREPPTHHILTDLMVRAGRIRDGEFRGIHEFELDLLLRKTLELGTGAPLHGAFAGRLHLLRRSLVWFMCQYLPADPPTIRQALFPLGFEGNLPQDPCDLLARAWGALPEGFEPSSDERHHVFEAQRDFVLAWLNLGMLLKGRWIGYRRSGEDFREIVQLFLKLGLFEELPRRVKIGSVHDKRDMRRTVWIEGLSEGTPPTGRQYERRTTTLYRATLALGTERMPVLIQVRRKGFFQTLGKLMTTEASDHVEVQDRRGICLAHRSVEELRRAADYIRERIPVAMPVYQRGVWERYRDNTVVLDGAHAPVNQFSAANFVAASYFRLLPSRRYQVQHRLARQHLDLIHSFGPENHTRYHLRQYTGAPPRYPLGLFHWLFPHEIYGFKWNEPRVFDALDEHIIMSAVRNIAATSR